MGQIETILEKQILIIDKLEKQNAMIENIICIVSTGTKPMIGGYLTRKEAAKKLRISLVTIHYWMRDGIIKSYKIGGRQLLKDSEIDDAINNGLKKHNRKKLSSKLTSRKAQN